MRHLAQSLGAAASENSEDETRSMCRDTCRHSVVAALQNCPYREVRRIAVEFPPGEVIRLSGVISSYYLKQMAQEIVRKAAPQCRLEECRLEECRLEECRIEECRIEECRIEKCRIENRILVAGQPSTSALKPR